MNHVLTDLYWYLNVEEMEGNKTMGNKGVTFGNFRERRNKLFSIL